jgi:hypothetical protein
MMKGLVVLGLALLLISCASGRGLSGNPPTDQEALLARATDFWQGWKQKQFETTYRLIEPAKRSFSLEEWASVQGAVILREFKILEAAVSGEEGFVTVQYTAIPEKYADPKPGSVVGTASVLFKEVWVKAEGAWYKKFFTPSEEGERLDRERLKPESPGSK